MPSRTGWLRAGPSTRPPKRGGLEVAGPDSFIMTAGAIKLTECPSSFAPLRLCAFAPLR